MKAVGKYIVINSISKKETQTAGGLLLNEESREDIRYREGNVIEVGEDVKGIKSGDEIYFDRHAGFGIEIKNKQYKVIKESDVVIIL
jgi:co-chaperonin GroES (HSP10)